MSEQERFEEWCRATHRALMPIDLTIYSDDSRYFAGEYKNATIEYAWQAWQARARLDENS